MGKALWLIIFMMLSAPALACSFDTDCSVGSKCYKPSGSIYGWCVGGLNPGA